MQEQRSRWERLKNYFAPKIKSEIILPAVVYDRGPLSKIVHRTILKFTSCRAPTVWGFRRLRTATMGFRPLTLTTLLKKGRSKTFPFLTGF